MAPQDLQHGHGTSNDFNFLSQTVYALSRQKLNELIKKLRDCGTEGVIRLPKIAVIGSQSVGKSSLIEAISQIKLPRKAGTACTRCPMEVILSSDDVPWICKISLRYQHEVVPFAETANKHEVTLLLRRAQLAILNPERKIDEFLELSDAECDSETVATQFSRDTVVIEISGAGVDVTFIDLPGIISHTEKPEDEHFIGLIKDLAEFYVSQEECLILLTISMKDDIDNQPAAQTARKYDPEGRRTIGVLTKADTVQQDEHGPWLRIMTGKSHVLRRGYYMTRILPLTPKDEAENKTMAGKERGFFSRSPWKELIKTGRLGTDKLTEALSLALEEMIKNKLPGLQATVAGRQKDLESDLDSLPESFEDNPQIKFINLCTEFISTVDEHTTAKSGAHTDFVQQIQKRFEKLKSRIHSTRPVFEISDESNDDESDAQSTLGSTTPAAASETEGSKSTSRDSLLLGWLRIGTSISLGFVKTVVQQKSLRELPDVIPFNVYETFIKDFLAQWFPICMQSFREIERLLEGLAAELCARYFGRFKSTGLLTQAKSVIHDTLTTAAVQTREQIRFFCGMECHRPFTLNNSHYRDTQSKILSGLTKQRRVENHYADGPTSISSTHTVKDAFGQRHSISTKSVGDDLLLDALRSRGCPLTSVKQLSCLNEVDEFEAELVVVSGILAYFEISSKRIIDIIPMIVEKAFICRFAKELRNVLTSGLGFLGEFGYETCAKYGKDEPEIKIKRQDLERKSEILSEALSILSGILN